MIRIQVYDKCLDCVWFANPSKCNEYKTCKDCPNGKGNDCACCEPKPEYEKECPYFKEKLKND